jgi:alpha-2-macroglobulin-like protein
MWNCSNTEDKLFEYLYGLLDDQDQSLLSSHCTECAVCGEKLKKASSQKEILVKASKAQFPEVKFTPPKDVAKELQQAKILQYGASAVPGMQNARIWMWAVASVLTLGIGVPAGIGIYDFIGNSTVVEHYQQYAARVQSNFNVKAKAVVQLQNEGMAKANQAIEEVQKKQLKVLVTGPATLQPGAPNSYQILTQDNLSRPVEARVEAFVEDKANPGTRFPVASQRTRQGQLQIVVPPDLPLRAGSNPTLIVSAKRESGAQLEIKEGLQLASAVYVAHLSTDKPMYQPGETVYFRALVLERFSLRPPFEDFALNFVLTTPTQEQKVVGQGGGGLSRPDKPAELIKGPDGKPLKGVGSGAFLIDPTAPGGEYILTVKDQSGRFPDQVRKFIVNRYQKSNINKELDFNRRSYGPGDEVIANCKAASSDGKPLSGKSVLASINLDGVQIGVDGNPNADQARFQTDSLGRVALKFKLPAVIQKGQASISVVFDDGGNTETLVKPVPVVVNKLDMEFFPEGGDLIQGIKSRIYFQARTPLGKPADVVASVFENGVEILNQVKTLTDEKESGINQGLGKFELTPKKDASYEVKITSPAGIAGSFKLPAIKDAGTVLRVVDNIIKPGRPLKVEVNSTIKSRLMVGVYCRGRLLESIYLDQGKTSADINLSDPIGGVCRVTVFEERLAVPGTRTLIPVAERLFFRTPAESLRIKLIPDHASYVPGQKVKLKIETSDEFSKLASSIIMLGVVDRSVLTMADEKTARTMPTHFLLTTEIRKSQDLEYTDVLLGEHPRASEALDLLLGSQGWRRFAEQDPSKFRQIHKEEADNLLVTIGQSSTQSKDLAMEPVDKIFVEYQKKINDAQAEADKALEAKNAAEPSPAVLLAISKLNAWKSFFKNLKENLFKMVGALILLLAAGLGINGLIYSRKGRIVTGLGFSLMGLALMLFPLGMIQVNREFAMQNGPAPAMEAAGAMPVAAMKMDILMMDEAKEMAAIPLPLAMKADNIAGGLNVQNQAPGIAGNFGAKPRMMANQNGNLDADQKGFNLNRLELEGRGVQNQDRRNINQEQQRAPQAGLLMKKALQDDKQNALGRPAAAAVPMRYLRAQVLMSPMVVREFAHERTQGERPELRTDFSETLCWKPFIITEDGKAEAVFDLSDSVTSFTATAFAHTLDGRLGSAKIVLESRLPLVLQPKIPLEISAGDEVIIPLAITSNSSEKRTANINLERFEGFKLLQGQANLTLELQPNQTVRKLYKFKPEIVDGDIALGFNGKVQGFAQDAIRQTIKVSSSGFPVADAYSDTLEGTMVSKIKLPESIIPGTLKVSARVYPSVLADLQKGLEGMLREPHGCFEQTSTTNYPNLLVLDYLRESNQNNPEIEKRALTLLENGYAKLTAFECMNAQNKKQGYEWFGGTAPAHEALTAYGLLQFRDMSRVMNVDQNMIKRTQDYIMEQRDGNGGFKRNPRALDSFGRAPDDITNAYIVWSLTESGKSDDVSKELSSLKEKAEKSNDPYFLALVANALLNRDDRATALALLKKLVSGQKEDGHLVAEKTSITGSGGVSLEVETTALAILALLKANEPQFNLPVRKAITWVGKQRNGSGAFGSTQSTILALKALIAFTKANKKTAEAGEVRLFLGSEEMAKFVFAAGATEVMELKLPNPEKNFKPGENALRLEVTGKNIFPATISWTYNTLKPVGEAKLPLGIETRLSTEKANEGDTLQLKLKVRNNEKKGQGMAVAVVGLPAGLSLPEDFKQLKQMCLVPEDGSRSSLSAFEVLGRELVLYWRDLAPEQNIELSLDLISRVPGNYSGQASRAYLYYNPELKHWVEPLKVVITPKD